MQDAGPAHDQFLATCPAPCLRVVVAKFPSMPTATYRPLASRVAVSLGPGALWVDFALYARALNWSAPFLGGVIGAGVLMRGLLMAAAGPLSDRWERRPFLLTYQAIALAAGIVATCTASR